MFVIGIDPGSEGGIAVLNLKNNNLLLHKMPQTPKDVLDFLKKFKNFDGIFCVLEKIGGMPKMGGVSMFRLGQKYAWVEMALLALEIRTEYITPQKWQKEFGVGTKGTQTTTQWKNKLKAKAQSLFPKNDIFLWGSDATLIAEYGKRLNR